MSFDISKLIADLKLQKQKYHAKVLSTSGININFLRLLDLLDLFAFYVWLYIPDFDFTDIALSLLLDIPPIEFQPISWNFTANLPDVSELLQGILVDIEFHDISEVYEWLKTVEAFIEANFEDELETINTLTGEIQVIVDIHESMLENRLLKAIYDKTPYHQSYYDPVPTREFIKSTLHKLFVERKTRKLIVEDIKGMAKAINISDTLSVFLYNKLSMILSARTSTFILGYSRLGEAYLAEKHYLRHGFLGKVRFYDFNDNLVEANVRSLDHIQIGFILGLTPLGLGFLMPYDTLYVKPKTRIVNPVAGSIETKGRPPIGHAVEYRARRIISQARWSAFSFANYNKPEEQLDFRRSERTDQWFNLQVMRYQIEQIVDPLIRQYESNPMKIRMYKSAALQLVSGKAKRHVWGYNAYEAMSEEEFYNWWIEHWKAQGLNPDLLNTIYTRVKPWLNQWRQIKYNLGKKLRERRYSLAQMTW